MSALHHQTFGRAYRPWIRGDVFSHFQTAYPLRIRLADLFRCGMGRPRVGALWGDILAPDACWVWRYVDRTFPRGRLFGFGVLEN